MNTGPKAEGKAPNPAKLQLQLRAKLRAGLISPRAAGIFQVGEGAPSSRRILGCSEGLRKSSRAFQRDGSTQDTATKRLALPGQPAQAPLEEEI